jgi:hypothetical protein
MTYGVSYEQEAEDDLDRIANKFGPLLASYVMDQIDECAKDPVNRSRRASFPHLPYPKFQFWGPNEEKRFHFTVLFRYLQDERTLSIVAIGFVDYG